MSYEAKIKSVGIRELKNGLSGHLREVRRGTTLLITDRGTVVAEIREPTQYLAPPESYTAIERWIEDGSVRPSVIRKRPLVSTNVKLPDGTARALLDQDRGE